MSWIYLIPPIALWILTKYGVPVASTFLILSVFSISDMNVFVSILIKSILGYVIAFFVAIIIYNIIARPLERYFTTPKNAPVMKKFLMVDGCKMVFYSFHLVTMAYAG